MESQFLKEPPLRVYMVVLVNHSFNIQNSSPGSWETCRLEDFSAMKKQKSWVVRCAHSTRCPALECPNRNVQSHFRNFSWRRPCLRDLFNLLNHFSPSPPQHVQQPSAPSKTPFPFSFFFSFSFLKKIYLLWSSLLSFEIALALH